ncbi:MAG: purine permease [Clostridia bacterium]|nr:purine permease [Clostridia bacterium]
MKKERIYSTPYELDGMLPMRQAVPLGLQHVLAMFVGNLSPLLIIMGICGITADAGFGALRVSLLQNAMLVAGLVTLLQLYPIGPVGGKLPIVMGTSSGFIGINKAIVASMLAGIAAGTITTSAEAGMYAYGAVMGASLIGGLFEGVLGFCIKPLRRFFPPIVTGTVVVAIGLSLISVGIGFFGGGSSNFDYGSMTNFALGLFTLIVIIVLKHYCKGFPSVASILLGIIAGYIASFIMGLFLPTTTVVDGVTKTYAWATQWTQVKDAAWFAVPDLLPVKLQFNLSAILPMLIMFVVTAVETIGDASATVEGGLGREATNSEISGAVICDGIGSSFAALFGVLPNTSFSQNVGLVGITKVVNRFAIATGAGILVLCGLFPKIGAIISIMPQPVLGGAAVMMFASIIISGIQLITKEPLIGRNATIVVVALGLGYGIGSTASVQTMMPVWMTYVFGGSGIVPAAILAILLNILIPKDSK